MSAHLPCPGYRCYNDATMDGHLCEACWAYRQFLILELAWLRPAVHLMLLPGGSYGQRVTGGAGPGSREPLRMAALEALEHAMGVVVGWATHIRERGKYSPMPKMGTTRESFVYPLALSTLERLDGILHDSWLGDDYYNDLLRAYMKLDIARQGKVSESEHIDGVCPNCASMSLCAREHRGYILCLTCGTRWGQAAWYCLTQLKE
jgi:hypothetical protein